MGITSFRYDANTLLCEEMPLSDIAANFGTPLYVYSRSAVVRNCRVIEEAFDGFPHLTTYAVKANSNVYLLRLIADQGLGADVGSVGELTLALKAGFSPAKISFSGVGKRDDEIEFALGKEILAFNVESQQEIDVINAIAARLRRTARILLRLNLDIDAGTHAYISTSRKHNKFGVAVENAGEVLRHAGSLSNIEVRGIHSHIGSQILRTDSFVTAAEALAGCVADLRRQGIPVHDLDSGGGFGVRYHGAMVHPHLPPEMHGSEEISPATFIKAVLPVLKKTGCNLAIQPGRSIVAEAGVLLTKVLYRKTQHGKTFVIVDGGMNDLIRPSLYQAHHQIVPLHLNNAQFEQVDVVGPCCESGDFFAQDRALPHVERGDTLAVLCSGAYGFVLASNYNARLRPAEVLVDGTNVSVIRKRETMERLSE